MTLNQPAFITNIKFRIICKNIAYGFKIIKIYYCQITIWGIICGWVYNMDRSRNNNILKKEKFAL